MKVDAVGSTILGLLVIVMGTLLVVVSGEFELAAWLQWALGITTITMGLVFVLFPWVRVATTRPQSEEFEEIIRKALAAPAQAGVQHIIEPSIVAVPAATIAQPVQIKTPVAPVNGEAGTLLLEDLRDFQLAELNTGKLKLAVVWLEMVSQAPEGLVEGWTRAEQGLDDEGDTQLPTDLQRLHDRMISLLVRANVLGKLSVPAYQAYGPVHQATAQEQIRNEVRDWLGARSSRVFARWASPSWQQGELRDIEANLFHLKQGVLAGWFEQLWVKVITDLIEEAHSVKDTDNQSEMLAAAIIIAGVFLNYAEKYGAHYAKQQQAA
jgi:flagellin-specific chaperone FliS